jgi:hypothetical protein
MSLFFLLLMALSLIFFGEFREAFDLRSILSYFIFLGYFVPFAVSLNLYWLEKLIFGFHAFCIGYSVLSFVQFVILGVGVDGFVAKDILGSSRVGFALIFCLYLNLYLLSRQHSVFTSLDFGALNRLVPILIIVGIFLTYSRSSIVALGCTGVFLFFVHLNFIFHIFKIKFRLGSLFLSLLNIVIVFVCLALLLSSSVDFFYDQIFLRLFVDNTYENIVSGSNSLNGATSESERFRWWLEILRSNAVWYGSGFNGIWKFEGFETGSTHSQYFDVLFRSGVFGLLIFLSINTGVFLRLFWISKLLSAGFVGFLVYGVFHETAREPIGLLVFWICVFLSQHKCVFSPKTTKQKQ